MAMSYNSLVADKTAAGSILNWVGNNKVDVGTVLDEAQALIYSSLRVRAMRTEWIFGIPQFQSQIALPPRFLDPAGHLYASTTGQQYAHLTEADVTNRRMYNSNSGALPNNAVTAFAGSLVISVNLPNHGLTIGSDFTIFGGINFINGQIINNTYKVIVVTDPDNILLYDADQGVADVGGTGGGANMTYIANTLIAGAPIAWAIWDELMQFDGAFNDATQFRLMCYRSLPLLAATNQTNFLTNRYPHLMRVACLASAASYRQDDSEYAKNEKAMAAIIQSIQAEDDLTYRGADLYTETP